MRTGMRRSNPLCAAVYLLSLTSVAVLADASNFCATAMNKKLCEETVKGATDWNQAITKAVTTALNQIEKVDHGQVKTSIHQTKSASVGSAVDRMCTEAYANAKDLLQESLDLIKNGDKTFSLNYKLSAALTSLEDCDNAFDDFKVDVASVQALNNDIGQAIRVCLAVDKSKSAARK
ncbi:unnamed protein product [Cuscuta epithymum]|uniref:Pectinesterase inhibitor domain-containing protein n=1 Tax=Cuscuta epithymum TaxID=186058 RepID=A0AAV0CIC9_9ASTE|nr:unnamed protein product [Cuscuta epithymum]CAH9145702.1 unnamed protein product [Cuscuta epithymum]